MKTEQIHSLTSSFEAHVRQTETGVEFWLARDLQQLLGYSKWDNFLSVVTKAKASCEVSGYQVLDHFADVGKMVSLGSGSQREIDDIMLTRYACYLIAQNGDPRKQEIAFAQTYFAIQTRRAELAVKLTPYGTRERSADEIVDEIRQKVGTIEGVSKTTFFVESGGPPVGKPVTIRVVGSNDSLRTAYADSVFSFLESIDGVTDAERDDKEGKEQIQINVRHDRLARLGLSVADIARTVRTAYDGQVVTSVRYGEEEVDFRVMLQKYARKKIEYLQELSIPNKTGRLIPLSEVADFEPGAGPSVFHHYDGERSITISSDVQQESVTPIEVMQAVEKHFAGNRDYPGVKLVFGGEAQESQESLRGLFVAFGVAAFGIYFLLILLFNSVTQPLLVMMSIPFGIIGVVITFALHGEVFSFLGLLGVVGMAGVVVNDSLVLVNYLNELYASGRTTDVSRLVAKGTADRLRAILLTTVTTAAGLLPLAYGIGGMDATMMPMALALGWGLLLATPLTLVLIPCLYMIGFDIGRLFSRRGGTIGA